MSTSTARKAKICLLCLMICQHCCSSSNVMIPLADVKSIIAEGRGKETAKAFKITKNDLGRGFKLNVEKNEDPFKDHVFRGELETSPVTTSTQRSSVVHD